MSFPSPPAGLLERGQTAAQTQQEETGMPQSLGKSVQVAERETLQHLQLLGDSRGPLESSRLQESGGDRRSSTTTSMSLKKKREERGRFSIDVNWQFAVQMPVGGTQECAALFVAFVQACLLAHQETSSASALLRAPGILEGSAPRVDSCQKGPWARGTLIFLCFFPKRVSECCRKQQEGIRS